MENKSNKIVQSYIKVSDEIGKRFYKIQIYFWIVGFVISTTTILWYRGVDPTFLPIYRPEFPLAFGIADFALFSAIFSFGAFIFASGVVVGVFVIPAIRKTDWKSIVTNSLLRKRRTVYTNVSDEQFTRVVGSELERVLKEYQIIPDKPTKEAFSEIFQRLTEMENWKMLFKSSHDGAFLCVKCDHSFKSLPPDPLYVIGTVKKPSVFEKYQKKIYECKECGHQNEIYWLKITKKNIENYSESDFERSKDN